LLQLWRGEAHRLFLQILLLPLLLLRSMPNGMSRVFSKQKT
jgi:hypothetical protein